MLYNGTSGGFHVGGQEDHRDMLSQPWHHLPWLGRLQQCPLTSGCFRCLTALHTNSGHLPPPAPKSSANPSHASSMSIQCKSGGSLCLGCKQQCLKCQKTDNSSSLHFPSGNSGPLQMPGLLLVSLTKAGPTPGEPVRGLASEKAQRYPF